MAVVKVGSVWEGCGPVLCGEGGTIQEGMNCDSKRVVLSFRPTVLGGTVGTSGFHGVYVFSIIVVQNRSDLASLPPWSH